MKPSLQVDEGEVHPQKNFHYFRLNYFEGHKLSSQILITGVGHGKYGPVAYIEFSLYSLQSL
jgi:hypothetical protein